MSTDFWQPGGWWNQRTSARWLMIFKCSHCSSHAISLFNPWLEAGSRWSGGAGLFSWLHGSTYLLLHLGKLFLPRYTVQGAFLKQSSLPIHRLFFSPLSPKPFSFLASGQEFVYDLRSLQNFCSTWQRSTVRMALVRSMRSLTLLNRMRLATCTLMSWRSIYCSWRMKHNRESSRVSLPLVRKP